MTWSRENQQILSPEELELQSFCEVCLLIDWNDEAIIKIIAE